MKRVVKKKWSERLANSTLVRITGLTPELENTCGHIIGYADEDPIIQLPSLISKKYSYTALVVPKDCFIKVEYDTAEYMLDSALEEFNLLSRWVIRFCRKLYWNLIDALQQRIGAPPVPSNVMLLLDDQREDSYRFSFHIHIEWHDDAGEDGPSSTTEFTFDIIYHDEYDKGDDDSESFWFKESCWHGTAHVEISCFSGMERPSRVMKEAGNCKFSQKLTSSFNMEKLISTWSKELSKIQQPAAINKSNRVSASAAPIGR